MGTRYTWVKALITTENRDRPGGHGSTYAADGMEWNGPYSPAGAKFLKRRTRRAQRREHARITREAIESFYADQEFDVFDTIEKDYEDYFHDDYDDYQDDYHDSDTYFDPYDDYLDDDGWAYYHYEDHVRPEDPHDRIIKYEDAGKSLGEILEEIRTRRI